MVQKNYVVGDASTTYWERKTQNGDDTPYALRRRGKWPVNRYTLSQEAQTQNFVRLYDAYGNMLNYGPYNVLSFGGVNLQPAVLPTEASVISKLGDKWRNTDLDLGMYLSPEGRESISMMTSGLMKISNSARQLRRGDFGGFLRNLNELPRSSRRDAARKFNQGDLSGSFLAAHLGWEPVIKDIYSASQGIADITDKPHRITATKMGYVPYWSGGREGFKYRVDQKVFVKLALDINRPPTFAQRFGLDNPFRIAWELATLSYVADYFLPIGSVIDAMGVTSALYGQKGFRKQLIFLDRQEEYPPGTCSMTIWYNRYSNREPIVRRYMQREFSRTPWTPGFTQPLRNLRVTLPSSIMKLSTMAALTHQRILSLSK